MPKLPTSFRANQEEYGELYKAHLFETYKHFIKSSESISERRLKANSFFLTLNSVIIALASYIKSDGNLTPTLLIPCIGILIGYIWYRLIRSYKDLNSAKFKVIHEIEQKLPLAVYETEWIYLGEGKDKSKYLKFTSIEQLVPWIFISIHFMVLAWNIRKYFI